MSPSPGSVLRQLVGADADFYVNRNSGTPAVFNPPMLPAALPTAADLDRAFAGNLLRYPYVKMVLSGDAVSPTAFSVSRRAGSKADEGLIDSFRVAKLLMEGATLLLPNLHYWHEPTAALARSLSAELGQQTEVFGFVTPEGTQGLDVHRDDADVLVVQISGKKHWSLFERPADGNWRPGPVTEPGTVLLETCLSPGQVLFVPRGAAHRATGTDGLSIHLSFVIRQVGVRHLVQVLIAAVEKAAEGLSERPLTEQALLAEAESLLIRVKKETEGLTGGGIVSSARETLQAMPAVAASGPLMMVNSAADK